jgi:hypothetical protein
MRIRENLCRSSLVVCCVIFNKMILLSGNNRPTYSTYRSDGCIWELEKSADRQVYCVSALLFQNKKELGTHLN